MKVRAGSVCGVGVDCGHPWTRPGRRGRASPRMARPRRGPWPSRRKAPCLHTKQERAEKARPKPRGTNTREAMCLISNRQRKRKILRLGVFARVEWQESRFQADAVGPVTSTRPAARRVSAINAGDASGKRRMPRPVRSGCRGVPKSAEFSTNCAASSAISGWPPPLQRGPRRVQEWLAGTGGLAAGDALSVRAVKTGRRFEDWAGQASGKMTRPRADPDVCREMA